MLSHMHYCSSIHYCQQYCLLVRMIQYTVLVINQGFLSVSRPEALFFLILYVVYCVAMAFNPIFEAWAMEKMPVPESWRNAVQAQAELRSQEGTTYKTIHKVQNGGGGIPMEELERRGQHDPDCESINFENGSDGNNHLSAPASVTKDKDESDPFTKPTSGGLLAVWKWAIMLPLYFLCRFTIPDCRKEAWAKSYVLTFLIAIIWISALSYMMVWMITVIGFTLGVPDTVMGLTFIAAGVSVPDALSGIAVVREGHGDMAVSNAIGSNVFDILVCLGLPWFLDTAIVNPDEYVKVTSKGKQCLFSIIYSW